MLYHPKTNLSHIAVETDINPSYLQGKFIVRFRRILIRFYTFTAL